ncbi:ATP-binding SpoIIE family protein phosphatase [Streptomyces hypolithicus]
MARRRLLGSGSARARRGGGGGPRAAVARRPTRDHLAWLNESGTCIGTTLDLQQTAREFAEFTVPDLADGAAVDLLESVLGGEEGERWMGPDLPALRAMAVAMIDDLANLEPDPVGEITSTDALLAMQCIMTRKPILLGRVRPEEFVRIAPSKRAAAQLRKAGVHSYMVVPLVARGVLLGAADFLRAGGRPPFTRTDLALAVELASKAAVFVDNARLYGREREHVVSLQRSLLPRGVPHTPGLEVSTCYAPTADPGGVGGDWFDVVALPGGRTALLVGDVMAHGLPAAATMGRLRTVARALIASLDMAPERMLARLDMIARDLEEDQVATCLCAVHDPADGSYTLARAGHLPPLLMGADGTAEYVDVPAGAPLGAGIVPYDPIRLTVPAGSRLILFTDGLVKNRTDDLDTQLERLLLSVTGMGPGTLDAQTLCAAGPEPHNRLDEAVVVIASTRAPSPDTDVHVWQLPGDGTAAGIARELVRERLSHWQLTEVTDVTELVVSELVGNALRYGGGPGQLRLLRHDRLAVEVSDTGPDLPQIQHTDLSDEGGRGLQLVNMLCRRWGACRIPGGKLVWAEQDIPDT